MKELIAIITILVIVTFAITYIVREKKKGVRCIGCPYGGNCAKCHVDECYEVYK